MKHFIGKILLFIIPVFLVIIFLPDKNIINFTSSVSLDSKIYELKKRQFDTISTIAVGSSMTLNNFNSETWIKETQDSSLYNISSWGQSIIEDCQIIQALVPIYHPSMVVIFAHCTDFRDSYRDSYIANLPKIVAYLKGQAHPIKYYFDALSIYYDTDDLYEFYKKDTFGYASLMYDEFGGSPLNVHGIHINDRRWNTLADFIFLPDNKCYITLSELCAYLKEQDILFILVNTPTRAHYYSQNLDEVYKHIHYCDSLISSYGQVFIDELNFQTYPDSLFADCSHLNSYGASMLTKNVCNVLKRRNIISTHY